MAYTLRSRIGRGKTVETFAGTLESDRGTRLDVAVKRPRPEHATERRFVDAYVEWGEAQRDVDHPHLVKVLEAGRTGDGAYVIQEKVEGASLSRVLAELRRRKRTLKPQLAFGIARHLASGLAKLHGSGHVHGGIDPSEVLISFDGDVKLGDQGLHLLDPLLGSDVQQGSTYLAPEIAAGGKPSTASDVFALALVFLEMLIGHAVWAGDRMTPEAAVQALRDFSHVGQAQPALTDDLITVLGMCVESALENRFPSAVEVHGELKRIAKKNELTQDDEALAAFVRALLPAASADEAPTMLTPTLGAAHDPNAEDAPDRREKIREVSVVVDPDLLNKALNRATPPPMVAPAPRPGRREVAPAERPWFETLAVRPDVGWRIVAGLTVVAAILLTLLLLR